MRLVVAALLLGFCTLPSAQVLTLAEVKAKNGAQLSADDLKRLMPNAKVVSQTIEGTTRNWNNGDGTFIASSDRMGTNLAGRSRGGGNGHGTWRIDEQNGTYCVAIEWVQRSEHWCRYIFKVGDKFYGFGKLNDDNQQSGEWEFSK